MDSVKELKEIYEREIEQLNKQLGSKDPIPYSFANSNEIEESMSRLEALQNEDTSGMDQDSDVFREYKNKVLKIENDVRIKLGLEPKPYHILDKHLVTIIRLGAEDEYLSTLEKYQHEEVNKRISDIKFVKERTETQELERLELLENLSDRIEQVESYKPEAYILDRQGHMIPNRIFNRWKDEIFSIKAKIENQIKLAESLNKEELENLDKRKSIFKLQEKINALIKKYDLAKGGEV